MLKRGLLGIAIETGARLWRERKRLQCAAADSVQRVAVMTSTCRWAVPTRRNGTDKVDVIFASGRLRATEDAEYGRSEKDCISISRMVDGRLLSPVLHRSRPAAADTVLNVVVGVDDVACTAAASVVRYRRDCEGRKWVRAKRGLLASTVSRWETRARYQFLGCS
jgi:hypothetical protein